MFEDEYVHAVIGPKLLPLCAEASSIKDVCSAFKRTYGYNISAKKLTHWLQLLGIRPEKKVLFVGLQAPSAAEPVGGDDIHFNPPLDTVAQAPSRFAPPIDIAPPMGMFTNVPMPGFSE